jgi:ParB family transcriptional regulator, chromosome partitioning protein
MIDPKKKSRLGRGLNSLMGMNNPSAPSHAGHQPALSDPPTDGQMLDRIDAPSPGRVAIYADVAPRGTPANIPIHQIDPNPRQPRRSFDEAGLAELAASIKSNGLIQPLTVKPVGDRFELIAGERRLRASKLASLTEVPAFIRQASELEQAQMALVENIQREDLNPIDRAAGYRVLVSELGLSQAELAGRLGEDRSTIGNHLRLLDLELSVLEKVRTGQLSLGHAKVICGVPDPAEQRRLAGLVLSQGLSVRNLERVLATAPSANPPKPDAPTPAPSAHIKDLEVNMSKQLGLRVQVKAAASKGKGKVVIHYNSLDEFDNLLGKIGVALEE